MAKEQCPKCGKIKASICIDCDEKKRRFYYQDIVYTVCRELERMRTHKNEIVVCGTAESPSTQVQQLVKQLVDCYIELVFHSN